MKIIQRYPLAAFFVIAFAITWILQLTGIFLATRQSMILSNESNFLHFLSLLKMELPSNQFLAYGLFTLGAGPLFSAILVTWILEGRDGLNALWQNGI
jgi:hypothetical protein